MTQEEMLTALYEKMAAEQDKLRRDPALFGVMNSCF